MNANTANVKQLFGPIKVIETFDKQTPGSQRLASNEIVLIGVRAGGARGAAAPPNFGQLRFFGQQEKIWAKPVFKDVSMFI